MAGVSNGCSGGPPSIREKSESAGFNGSFEIVKSGLPVNWYIHYPPIENGDAELSLDARDAIEGNRSLKLIVHRAEPVGGWRTAGLFQVTPAKAKSSYKVSFWLKNQGCKIRVIIRNEGKDPIFGPSKVEKEDLAKHPPIRKSLGEEETGANTWRQFEYIYAVPETDGSIRFELNILQPGTLWIDDVRIEEVP
jgi:hypothetical protein